MANGYQKHILIGNLGADPRVNQTRNGNLVTNFDIAVNERGVDGTQGVTWYGITAWNGLGEACAEYLTKGRQVMVEGTRLEATAWMGRDGNIRTKMELTAKDVRFLGDANGQQQAPQGQQAQLRQQRAQRQQAPRQQSPQQEQAPQQPQQQQTPRRQSAPAPRQRRQRKQRQQHPPTPQQQVTHGYIPDNPEDMAF